MNRQPVTDEELLFVKMLFLHLDTVRRAAHEGMFVKLQGLKRDVADFMSLSIPRLVWQRIRPFQDKDFIEFIEECQSQS